MIWNNDPLISSGLSKIERKPVSKVIFGRTGYV